MKEVLHNIAMLDALKYCRENGIDCSGTHLVKYQRGYTYSLVKDEDGRALITTTFYKNRTPFHSIHKPQPEAKSDIINIDDIPF